MTNYAPRREANEQSLTTAEHHREIWEQHEIELLEECFGEETIEEIAETLGRTIEACRQKHYSLEEAAKQAGRTKRQKSSHNSQWDKGWTSLEDMGF